MNEKMIELLILFAIAAFVLYRLKSVIGTRTGYEAPPEQTRAEQARNGASTVTSINRTAAAELDDAELDVPMPPAAATAVTQMRAVEPNFTVRGFMDGARSAYEMILMAYEGGDRTTLKNLLAPDVYSAFDQMIAQRETQGLKVDSRFVGVRDVRLEGATFDSATKEADLTLRFVGEMITAVRDAENRVVEGDPNEVRRQTDVWTFSRKMGSRDPNWLLTATGE